MPEKVLPMIPQIKSIKMTIGQASNGDEKALPIWPRKNSFVIGQAS